MPKGSGVRTMSGQRAKAKRVHRSSFVPAGTAQAVSGSQDATTKIMESLPPFSRGQRNRGPRVYSTPSGERITANQEVYCRLVALGWPITDAYRYCYACEASKPRTIERKAWDLANRNPATVSRIKELVDARVAGQLHQASYLRAHVVERLFAESTNAREGGTRVRALELLGKIGEVGLFDPPKPGEMGPDLGLTDLRDKLRDRLKAMLGPGMIDVSEDVTVCGNKDYVTDSVSKSESDQSVSIDVSVERETVDRPAEEASEDPHPPGEAP
jgi:hypothetical protein